MSSQHRRESGRETAYKYNQSPCFAHDIVSKNQFRFTPPRNNTDAAMAVRGFVEVGLSAGEIIALISLDIKDALDAAWWPSILKWLRAYNYFKNLYNLSKSYFSQRFAVISLNNVSVPRTVTKRTLQGSCCRPGYWKTV